MTVPSTLDAAGWLRNHLEDPDGDQDLARSTLQAFAEALMSAEASMQCQAAYGERSDERTNSRNGYRERRWDTRVGTIPLNIPKLREGSYFPQWLLVHRRRPSRRWAPSSPGLRRGRLDAPGGGSGGGDGHRRHLGVGGVAVGRHAG